MTIAPTPKPAFPNVPQFPGAPVVPSQVGAVQNTVVSTIADIGQIANIFFPPQWGLYTAGGSPVLTASAGLSPTNLLSSVNSLASVNGLTSLFSGDAASVRGVEFRRTKRISTAPQELGAFLSYNKVSDPFQGRVIYLQGGSNDDRASFLQQVDQALNTLTLFLLVMPDYTYANVNVVDYSYSRTSRKGMTLLEVEVQVEEVRITGTAQFSSTTTPAGASATNTGTVQPQAVPNGVPTAVQGNGLPAGAVT